MKSFAYRGRPARVLTIAALCLLVNTLAGAASTPSAKPAHTLLLWDTGSPLADRLEAEARSQWKTVPNDLLRLEKDPPKASSDPGYYGREYSFQGDAVVETPGMLAAFHSIGGTVAVYLKQAGSGVGSAESISKTLEVSPYPMENSATRTGHLEILRNADDEVCLKISFSGAGSTGPAAVFAFDKTGVVEVRPTSGMKSLRLSGSIEYGVVPAFIGDDLVYGGTESSATDTISVPSENLFLGLLSGHASELLMTWPAGKQSLTLQMGDAGGIKRIRSIDFDPDARSFYLAFLSGPGIWHNETLTPDDLEKDVRINWKRPFPAKWKTQLYEEDVKATFAFRESKGEIWRGVPGSYVYPVWFSGEDAYYRLGKKIQPKGEALIYCLEGRGTPATMLTPVEILKQTLGRQAAEPILDVAGRKLRTHHRRGASGVRRACTCGCTEAIQAVFEAHEEVSQKEQIQEALDDMIFFVHRHVERINEYQRFAEDLIKWVAQKKQSSPGLKPFLDSVEEIAQQIPQECEVQKENMKNFDYADELSRKTVALAAKKDPSNLKAYMDLLKAWREMGGAQDYVLAKCHTTTRNLSQTAGYGCATQSDAVPLAQEIRARCRQVLRNPDGYEIWADY